MVTADGVWRGDPESGGFVEALRQFGPAENVRAEEITEEQYRQVMTLEFIRAEFNYNIPTADFCRNFRIQKSQGYDVIETVTAIGYSSVQGGNSLFVHDGKNNKYYRLVAGTGDSGGGTAFPALLASIAAEEYTIYYPASRYLGVENTTLVPLSVKAGLVQVPFLQEVYPHQTEKISAIAEQFFGGNFDFVRNITEENGTVIYMYGYGQNVLIVNTDGSIEYKEGQLENVSGQSFSDALETAVSFVANHGSWEALGAAGLTPYLKAVVRDPDSADGRRFIFGVELSGSQVCYEDGDPIVVGVTSGQVTYYKRHLISIDPQSLQPTETIPAEDAFSAVNLIAENYRYIYDILLSAGNIQPAADQTEMFETVAALVKDMKTGYVKPTGEAVPNLQPAWIVEVGNAVIYFDLYTAEPIGYS
jgi:hypothetical protein